MLNQIDGSVGYVEVNLRVQLQPINETGVDDVIG